jgi:hypothetical protein
MEEKQSLEDELDKLMKSRDELYNTTSKELWKRELNELRKKI